MYFLWELIVDIWDTIIICSDSARRWKRQERNRIGYYMSATAHDLLGMPDVEVLAVAWYQLTRKYKIHKVKTLSELMSFNAVQRIFWVLNVYEQKNDGGGMMGFLTSEGGYVAPMVIFALEAVGAYDHLALFSDFIERNGIDPCNISAFDLTDLKGKKRRLKQEEIRHSYNFTEFDEKYLSLEPIEELLTSFIRENAELILEPPFDNA